MLTPTSRPLVWGAILLVSGLAAPAHAQETDARALVQQVLDALPREPVTAKMTLSSDQWAPRVLQLSRKYVSDTHASYLEVVAPEELQGIRFLFLERPGGENEQYIKVAGSRTSVRVTDEVRKQPFLGSAFYVSDLVIPELDDFTYTLAGETELLGRRCRLVEATPKRPELEPYSKSILALDPTDRLILRREFFDRKGRLFKVWTIEKVEKVDGIWTLLQQQMANVQDKTTARLEVTEVKYNVDLKDLMFTPTYLLR
jgi:outer membrane lipoprotein-sorting protein